MMVAQGVRVALAIALMAAGTTLAGAQHASGIGTWATAPISSTSGPGSGKVGETLRDIVHVSIGGQHVTVTLSNEFGIEPLTIGSASIGLSKGGGRVEDHVKLTFHGKPDTVIAAGAVVQSDLAAFKFAPLSDVAVSFFLPAQRPTRLTQHDFANTTNYIAPGEQVGATKLSGARELLTWRYLKEIAVPEVDGRGVGNVVCLGASIVDGEHSSLGMNRRWPDVLARRLQSKPQTRQLGVLNMGIRGNQLLRDGAGQSALARFDRDVVQGLSTTGENYLIVMVGSNDIRHGTDLRSLYDAVTSASMIAGYTQIARRAHAHGIRVYGATLTPFAGAGYASAAAERMRAEVNEWIRTTKEFDGLIDFDKAVRDPGNPTWLLPEYDSGDHLHPNDAGYKAMGDSIDLKLFTR